MAVVKPKMKSYIWLQTVDGSVQQVEEEVAMFCPRIHKEILKTGMGSSKTYAITLPERVKPAVLGLIFDYCRFHIEPGHSTKERKTFDEKFIRLDFEKLSELTFAAHDLQLKPLVDQLKPLVDLACQAFARITEGKSPKEIRETFRLPNNLTKEEKLVPLKNIPYDLRIRLVKRLYAKKRKELKEMRKLKNVQVGEETKDERSVDDLLSFINGADGGTKGTRANKNKKKNKRRKDHAKDPSKNANENLNEESNHLPLECHNGNYDNALESSPSKHSRMQEQDLSAVKFSPNLQFIDDGDLDDDLDPALKEELDREVEDFARRLNSDWDERLQEILSLGQDRRLGSIPMNGNGSTHFNTSN